MERQADVFQLVEDKPDLPLDNGAVRYAAHGRHSAGDGCRFALRGKSADRHAALGHRVYLAIRAQQRGHQKGAAFQAGGIAKGADGDVHAGALCRKGTQIAGDHDGRHIVGAQIGVAGVDAKTFQHRLQALLGERGAVEGVAGAVEADHQPVADQLVFAKSLDGHQILDARCGQRGAENRVCGDKYNHHGRRQTDRYCPVQTLKCHLSTSAPDGLCHQTSELRANFCGRRVI